MQRLTLFLLACVISASAAAHKDRRLSVAPDGSIPELPTTYASTRLHVGFAGADSKKLSELTITSSGRKTSLRPCLLALVSAHPASQMSLTGSWYHDESRLPHYLQVRFSEQEAQTDLRETPAVLFLFSLRDASLLQVTIVRDLHLPDQQAEQYQELKLHAGCPI
jgi:hypothetical protein